jgi:hypothetical protein
MTKKQLFDSIKQLLLEIKKAESSEVVKTLALQAHGLVTFGTVDKRICLGVIEGNEITTRIKNAEATRLEILASSPAE